MRRRPAAGASRRSSRRPWIARRLWSPADRWPRHHRTVLAALDRSPARRATGRPARRHARAATGGRALSLSYSQLDDYLACPLKYRLRHIVRIPTPPHHALVLGNALHQAVAAYHAARIRGRSMTEGQLLDVFATHWSSEGFLSRAHEEARFAAGQEALRRFLADESREEALVPVAVERPFAVHFGRDMVRGRYDRVDETPDGIVITDYKSSDVRDPKKATQKARDSLQLQLYALAHEAETGELAGRRPAALPGERRGRTDRAGPGTAGEGAQDAGDGRGRHPRRQLRGAPGLHGLRLLPVPGDLPAERR